VVAALCANQDIRVTVISGRRLSHIEKLVPAPGVMLAGTYGIEIRMPAGSVRHRVPYTEVRPVLETIKPRWGDLIRNCEGCYLEDKGWALALHGRFAADVAFADVLAAARRVITEIGVGERFRILEGHKFLEIGPRLAHKGRAVDFLLDHYPLPGALLLYLGDDDKDEEAFSVIRARGGLAIVVSSEARKSQSDARLDSPQDARAWLAALARDFVGGSRPDVWK
ncbi:MAG: trehalose-phosphatase, partial [Anaerolineae bacterium]|nr:trehalose-phosphatase [Anaerolineae bacterium]